MAGDELAKDGALGDEARKSMGAGEMMAKSLTTPRGTGGIGVV